MADEDPSAINPAADDANAPKKETVRITLPPRPEDTPMVKRETVRINAPGVTPKKETTTIQGATPLPAASAPVPPASPATRPLVPPPRPPSAPGIPTAGARPGIAPKPMPIKPASAFTEAKPVTPVKAAPKKETARIQMAPAQKLPPQATVKLSSPSTQALATGPASAVRTAPAPSATEAAPADDKILTILSFAAVVVALAAAALSYMAYSA